MKGTAVASDVLSGKTFTNASSVNISGTMTNNGAVSITITPNASSQSYTIPKGYHNGSGKVTVNAANIAAPLNNWQIGGSKTGSGFNEEYLVGNRLFTLTQANNGYLSLILTTNRACYLTIVKYVGTYGNAAGTYTATVIKKNAYTAAGYKYESPSEQSSIHIFAYTL